MNKIYIFISLFLSFSIVSCIKESHFGYSDDASITSIQISNQNGNAVIQSSNDSIYIQVANGTDMKHIIIRKLDLASYATCPVSVGDTLDFSTGQRIITVTAESGKQTNWNVSVYEIGSQPQLQNSDFNTWHQYGSYMELGPDESTTIWGTSNTGAVFGGMDPNVQQLQVSDTDYAMKITTRYSLMGSWVKKPIASGSAFTGYFTKGNISFNDPNASVVFGTPFSASPTAFSVQYQYTPGPTYIDSTGTTQNQTDSCDIYVLLERRIDSTHIQRVATGWFRSSQTVTSMQTIKVNLTYGQLPAGSPYYMLPKAGQTYAPTGTTPTHITVVFASSAKGDSFQGAKNSVLIIDNLVLYY